MWRKPLSHNLCKVTNLLESWPREGALRAESESLSTEGEEQPEDLSEPEAIEGSLSCWVSTGERCPVLELEEQLS